MKISKLLQKTLELKASDLHITVASPPIVRVNGRLVKLGDIKLEPDHTEEITKSIMTSEQYQEFSQKGELDFSFSNSGLGRFRVNAYKQRGSCCLAIRVVAITVPTLEELSLPPIIKELANKQRGLILVTGPTGSGKTTTLASMIDYMNKTRANLILTLEDPIEYLHKHNKSIINQREIGNDSYSFANALRAALRQDPDVILVGEMRDLDTISIAITAAETGHLVLSTLHTMGAVKTIDRIIDVFPTDQQQQIRVQLSSVLEGVISQQLLPKADGSGRVGALEIMVNTPAIGNLIREGKTHQMHSVIQTGGKFGMQTMDSSLMELYRQKIIDKETLVKHVVDGEMIKRQISF